MWNWFTQNSVWFLIAAVACIAVLLFLKNRFKSGLAKLTRKEMDTKKNRIINLLFMVALGVLLAVMVAALVAIIGSKEGAFSVVTSDDIQEWLLTHGVIIIAYLIIFYLLYRLVKYFIPKIVAGFVKAQGRGRHSKSWFTKRTKTLSDLFVWIIDLLLGTVILFMILDELGINIAPLLASAGVAGVAIGFGAQNIVKDFLGGMFISLEDQYNTGDVVEIAGISGTVVEVNLRRTVLRDLDGTVHSIPNGIITTASNYTRDWARVKLDVAVSYGEDLDKVFAVINKTGDEMAADAHFGELIRTPLQALRVQKFGEYGIEIRILGDVHSMAQWEVAGELRKRLKKAFDEAGIQLAWRRAKLYLGYKTGNDESA